MSIKYGSAPPPPNKKPKKRRKSRSKTGNTTPGRPAHVPDQHSRNTVDVMLAAGMMHVDICRVLDITEPTLQKYYRAELDSGGSKANAAVVATLFKLAVSGKCPAATFFFLKTRMRWRETSPQPIDDHEVRPTRVEVSWKDPDPPPPTDKVE